MKVTVTRTGGFAGVHQVLGPIDLDDADPEVRVRISTLIKEMDFFDLPNTVEYGRVFDGFRDRIQVTDGDRVHEVRQGPGDNRDPRAESLGELVGALVDAGYDFADQPRQSGGGE